MAGKLRFFSTNPSKRGGEIFFLWWSLAWMIFFSGIVVTRWYEVFTAWHYMGVGLALSVIPILGPLILPVCAHDRNLPWHQRYTTKANLWVWIISFIGNYLWTHYFYNVLGTSYTMPRHDLNEVPFALYLITHSYFLTYHTLATISLRIVEQLTSTATADSSSKHRQLELPATGTLCFVARWTFIVVLSTFLAFMEAFTLENYPHYVIKDRFAMYTVGALFYAIYFVVSFPMFRRVDERCFPSDKPWTLGQTALDSFAACMIVTMLLDFWRLFLGPVIE